MSCRLSRHVYNRMNNDETIWLVPAYYKQDTSYLLVPDATFVHEGHQKFGQRCPMHPDLESTIFTTYKRQEILLNT